MHAQTFHLDSDSAFQPIFENDISIDRGWIERPIQAACPIVFHRPEEGAVSIVAMLCQRQIILDHAQGGGIDRNKANFTPLAVDPKMLDAFPRLKMFQAQSAELLAGCRDPHAAVRD